MGRENLHLKGSLTSCSVMFTISSASINCSKMYFGARSTNAWEEWIDETSFLIFIECLRSKIRSSNRIFWRDTIPGKMGWPIIHLNTEMKSPHWRLNHQTRSFRHQRWNFSRISNQWVTLSRPVAALLSDLQYFNIAATLISVGRSRHDIFYFFGEKKLASVVKVPATTDSRLLFWTMF